MRRLNQESIRVVGGSVKDTFKVFLEDRTPKHRPTILCPLPLSRHPLVLGLRESSDGDGVRVHYTLQDLPGSFTTNPWQKS